MAGQQGPAGSQYGHLEEVGDWFIINNCDKYPQSSSLVPKLFHTVVSNYLSNTIIDITLQHMCNTVRLFL